MAPQKDNISSFFIASPRAVARRRRAAVTTRSGCATGSKTIRSQGNEINQRAYEALRKRTSPAHLRQGQARSASQRCWEWYYGCLERLALSRNWPDSITCRSKQPSKLGMLKQSKTRRNGADTVIASGHVYPG